MTSETSLRLICESCQRIGLFHEIISGSLPLCGHCGGAMALPCKSILGCRACGVRARPARPAIAKAAPCPKCGKALEVLEQEGDASQATLVMGDAADPKLQKTITMATQGESSGGARPGAGLEAGSFGKFEILGEIARGGMGIVYRARDPALKRVVALKVLIAGEAATEDHLKRFIREARAASQLRHPNIVSVHEAGEIGGQHFFTMDFIEGVELGAMHGKSLLRQQLGWIRQVALALDYAHEKGIVHRDLKPSNIMVDKAGQALVMDFGLAKDQGSQSFQSLTGTVFGTPAYMSPEQARGENRKLDRRSDIYSLGAVLYEMTTGKRPFAGETMYDTMHAVIHEEPAAPRLVCPSLDVDLQTVILKCLEKDPARRYQSMRELADDLERCAKHEAIAARPVPPLVRQWRRLCKQPALLAGLAAVPAVLLVALLAALMHEDFYERLRREIATGKPERVEAAMNMLDSQFAANEVEDSDRDQALTLARSAIGGDSDRAEATAWSILAKQHDRGLAQAALQVAENKDFPEERRARAMKVLAEADPDSVDDRAGVCDRIFRLLDQEKSPQLGVEAVRAGAALGDADVAGKLIPIARDKSRPRVVRLAAIGYVGLHSSLTSPGMLELLRLHADEDSEIAAAAERALAVPRNRNSVLSLYGAHGAGAEMARGMGNLMALNAQRNREMQEIIDEDEGKASATMPVDPVAAIGQRLQSADVSERLAAVYDLGQLGDAAAIPHLEAALGDADGTVRKAAARALARLSRNGSTK